MSSTKGIVFFCNLWQIVPRQCTLATLSSFFRHPLSRFTWSFKLFCWLLAQLVLLRLHTRIQGLLLQLSHDWVKHFVQSWCWSRIKIFQLSYIPIHLFSLWTKLLHRSKTLLYHQLLVFKSLFEYLKPNLIFLLSYNRLLQDSYVLFILFHLPFPDNCLKLLHCS